MELLRGIRVLDVSSHGAVPIAGSILADWGADVIKVEDPEHGEVMRGGVVWGVPLTGAMIEPASRQAAAALQSNAERSTAIMAKSPPIITMNCMKSVQMTAFIPPSSVYTVVAPPMMTTHSGTARALPVMVASAMAGM